MPSIQVDPVLDEGMRMLCLRPYPGHSKGCQNFGKKVGCPPKAPLLHETLDLGQPVWAVYNVFDMAGHVAKMRGLHPSWSMRQLVCCLYWQKKARKSLREEIAKFLEGHPGTRIIACPEAQGVNLTATMISAGIEMEWPPVNRAFQIVLAGKGRT